MMLHDFCAKRRYAPELLGSGPSGELPGGWLTVAMDFVSPSVHPSQSPDLPRLLDEWITQLQTLMQSFHDQ